MFILIRLIRREEETIHELWLLAELCKKDPICTGAPTVEYSNTGTAVTYARERNIETAFVLETSWNVID